MSKVIKSHFAQTAQDNERVITLKPLAFFTTEFEEELSIDEVDPPIDMKEVEARAESMIKAAEREAAEILNSANHQYDEMMHQIEVEKQNWAVEKDHWVEMAKQEGYEAGFDEGKQAGFNEYKLIIEDAKQTVQLAKNDYQKNIEQSEMTILHLGLKTAEKIMGFTLDFNPDAFLNVVKRVIKEAKDHQDIQIHVHPQYYELLLSQKEELRALVNHPAIELFIFPDDELEPTNCMLESSFGRIEASIDSQLNQMKIKLLQILEGEMDDEGS